MAIARDEAAPDVEVGGTESPTGMADAPMPRGSSGVEMLEAILKEQSHDFDQEMPTPGEITVVESLQEYDGQNLYEKIDSFVAAHQVVLVNRSWCLFSVDATDFLSRMGVAIHVLDVDNHPHESTIVKHLKTKYSHGTSPWIFIEGEFVGGYEDVNSLYSKGSLQNDYLSHLTQADKCELIAAKSSAKPLLWFPAVVNAHAVRATGVATFLFSAASAALSLAVPPVGQLMAYYLVVDFILRIAFGARFAPIGFVSSQAVSGWESKPRSGRPKQFAACCGLLFSVLASLFYLTPFPYHDIIGAVFVGILAICTGMEGFLDFCLGCVFFRIGLQLRIIPK